jgi:hypothetical protein
VPVVVKVNVFCFAANLDVRFKANVSDCVNKNDVSAAKVPDVVIVPPVKPVPPVMLVTAVPPPATLQTFVARL